MAHKLSSPLITQKTANGKDNCQNVKSGSKFWMVLLTVQNGEKLRRHGDNLAAGFRRWNRK